MVASDRLLTAAHCVNEQPPEADVFVPKLGTYYIGFGNVTDSTRQAILEAEYGTQEVSSVMPFPTYTDGTKGAYDFALVHLSKPIPRHLLTPMRVAASTDYASYSGQIRILGYGRSGQNCTEAPPGGLRWVLGDWWGTFPSAGSQVLSVSFPSKGSHVCDGDSGGPWLRNGQIIGTTVSTLSPYVEASGAAILLPEHRAWLQMAALDTDGDGYESWEDNCEGTPSLDLSDYDGDGIGDVCDECPFTRAEWSGGVGASARFGHPDFNGDGKAECIQECNSLADDDHDGVYDCVDPCRNAAPMSADAKTPYGDDDNDGVCNDKDTCPNVAENNHFQENSNRLSEKFHSPYPRGLGDACDPVPVPAGKAGEAIVAKSLFDVDNQYFRHIYRRMRRDKFTITPLPSRPAPEKGSEAQARPVHDVDTHFRFCQTPVTVTQDAPACDSEFAIQDIRLNDAEDSKQSPYHRVTLVGQGTYGLPKPYNHLLTPATFEETWDYKADFQRWDTSDAIELGEPQDPDPVEGYGSALDGMFWAHAATNVGTKANDIDTGVHAEQLANSHFEMRPAYLHEAFISHPVPDARPFFLWRTLPDPPPYRWLEAHRPGEHLMLTKTVSGDWGLVVQDHAAPAVTAPVGWPEAIPPPTTTGGQQSVVPASPVSYVATAQIVTDRLGTGLQQSLANSSLRWANAVDVAYLEAGAASPIAVALSSDGKQIAEIVTQNLAGDALLGAADRGVALPIKSVTPPSVSDSVTVYSRFFDAIFSVGSGQSNIWKTKLDGTPWTQLYTGVTLGRVLAATVSYADSRLWVMDEVEFGLVETRLVRLWAFNVFTGEPLPLAGAPNTDSPIPCPGWVDCSSYQNIIQQVEMLADSMKETAKKALDLGPVWYTVRSTAFDGVGLQLDVDGSVLLVASNSVTVNAHEYLPEASESAQVVVRIAVGSASAPVAEIPADAVSEPYASTIEGAEAQVNDASESVAVLTPSATLVHADTRPVAWPFVMVDQTGYAFSAKDDQGRIIVTRRPALENLGDGWLALRALP